MIKEIASEPLVRELFHKLGQSECYSKCCDDMDDRAALADALAELFVVDAHTRFLLGRFDDTRLTLPRTDLELMIRELRKVARV